MIWTLVMLGCVEGPGGALAVSAPDFEDYVNEVQPILAATCSNASCHGDPARPLEIYAVHNHRLDPDEVYLDGELTQEELWLNYLGVWAFVEELANLKDAEAGDCAILTKPLDPEHDGADHQGGILFFDTEDRGYQAIFAWIADTISRKP
jgi:hypothetical protein